MGEHVIKLPDVGEGVAEAELVEWHVKVGDLVREDTVLAAVMTDKATVEIPSPSRARSCGSGPRSASRWRSARRSSASGWRARRRRRKPVRLRGKAAGEEGKGAAPAEAPAVQPARKPEQEAAAPPTPAAPAAKTPGRRVAPEAAG